MNEHEFFQRVKAEIDYLSEGQYSFDELLKISQNDRRVRNAFVFYVLSDKEYFQRFKLLSKKSLFVGRLKKFLLQALNRIEKDELYRSEVRSFARYLHDRYLVGECVVYEKNVYDVSVEMEKFFVSIVNCLLNENEENTERDKYTRKLLKSVDFDNLFIRP